MPVISGLFPDQVEVVPPIFHIQVPRPFRGSPSGGRLAVQIRWNQELAAIVRKGGGCVYESARYVVFFGFPNSSTPVALRQARGCAAEMQRSYADVVLSVSTIGLARDIQLHGNPVEHIGSPEFREVLFARIKFLSYKMYLTFRRRFQRKNRRINSRLGPM